MSQEPDYSMEAITKTMLDHAELTNKIRKSEIERYKEQYPDCEIPENLKEKFNVYKAVSEMALQIALIRMFLNDHLNEHEETQNNCK